MKIISFVIALAMLAFGGSAFAQHTNQVDDGAGHTLSSKDQTLAEHTSPAGGRALVTSTSPGAFHSADHMWSALSKHSFGWHSAMCCA